MVESVNEQLNNVWLDWFTLWWDGGGGLKIKYIYCNATRTISVYCNTHVTLYVYCNDTIKNNLDIYLNNNKAIYIMPIST